MSISNSGEVGMFTKDISKKIIDRKFDLAIHSWKDLPIEPSKETEIIGTLERGDIRDVLLIKSETVSLKEKDEMEILTSSPRRKYNLAKILQDYIPLRFKSLKFSDVRGNIDTRLNKIEKCVVFYQMTTFVGDDIFDSLIKYYNGICKKSDAQAFLKENDSFIDF